MLNGQKVWAYGCEVTSHLCDVFCHSNSLSHEPSTPQTGRRTQCRSIVFGSSRSAGALSRTGHWGESVVGVECVEGVEMQAKAVSDIPNVWRSRSARSSRSRQPNYAYSGSSSCSDYFSGSASFSSATAPTAAALRRLRGCTRQT
jgi:hypothetical protein